jgi:hypothetical protein
VTIADHVSRSLPRGEDGATSTSGRRRPLLLLQRLVERGLLARVRDDRGRRPNVYSVTAKACGRPASPRWRPCAAVAAAVRPEEQMRLEAAMADSAEEPALQEATGS